MRRVIVVDDLKQNRYLLQKLLEGHNYTVETASNGVEALEKARKSVPDMIITDALMPKMDGFQLCRKIKSDDALKDVPVLFYSATYTDKKSQKLALDIGAVEYIIKPQEPRVFVKIINKIWDKYSKGKIKPTKKPLEEKVYMKMYNERLIQKLEKKMLNLEKSEKRLKYLYSVLGAIRGVNQLIVREKNRNVLLQKSCDTLTKARGYNTAWLGFLKDEKTFAMVVGSPLKEDVSLFCEQVLRGDHPPCIKKALTKKDLFLFMDRSRDCGDCSLKKLHLGRNSLLIRITHKSKLFGFLVLSLEPNVYIDQEEKELLEEVTSDIAFGLYSIELEEQHKQAEEKYQTLYETIKEGIAFSDMEGNILDANQAFLDMLGYRIEEIRRLNYYELTPKKWHKITTDIIKNQTMARGYSKEYEKEYIKKDGTTLPITIRSWLTKDKQGKSIGTWAIMRDITERKRAIEEIEKLAKFPTENPNPVLRISKDGTVLYHNSASESLLRHWHYKEGKPLQDRWFQFVLDALKDDDIKTVDTKIGDKVISLTFAPIVEKDFVNVYGLDITERKQAEEEIRLHAAMMDNVAEGVYLIGLDDLLIKWTNERFVRMFGYDPGEMVGKHVDIINAPTTERTPTETRIAITNILKETREWHGEIRNIKRDGTHFWCYANISLFDHPEYGKIIVAVSADITERKKAEQKLLQSHNKLLRTMEDTIYTIGKISETRDPYTAGHQKNVSQIATFIAQEMKLPKDKIEGIRIASLVHDIGKISIPSEILNKPTKLREIEFSLIKDHSQVGHDVLKSIDFPWPVARIVLQHHERLNGSGYPNNLKYDKIMLEARIIGVADVVEAMSSHRPYRPALGTDAALEDISKNKGTLYEPEAVDACIKLFKEKRFKL